MSKRIVMAFGLGAAMPLMLALWLGGETLAQAGLRLAAIEQGFALASRHWSFDAVPEHDPELVAQSEPEPVRKPAPKKVAKAR